jgi:hypothetical protein
MIGKAMCKTKMIHMFAVLGSCCNDETYISERRDQKREQMIGN